MVVGGNVPAFKTAIPYPTATMGASALATSLIAVTVIASLF